MSDQSPLRVDHDRGQAAVSNLPFLLVATAVGVGAGLALLSLWRLARLLIVVALVLFFTWLLQFAGQGQIAL